MLMNNLDPDVAERPEDLVVYGGTGKAARDWPLRRIVASAAASSTDDETLLVQSGKPVGVFRTHADAPRVLIANSNLVGQWATWEHFRELEAQGPDDVRPDDGRLVDLHRHPGHPAGHLRDLRRRPAARTSAAPTSPGRLVLTGGPGRHGRRAAAGGDDERRGVPRRRGGPDARAAPRRDALPGRDRARTSTRRCALAREAQAEEAGALDRRSIGNAAEVYPELVRRGRRAGPGHRSDLARTIRSTATSPRAARWRQAAELRERDPAELRAARAARRWRRTSRRCSTCKAAGATSSTTATTCAPRREQGGLQRRLRRSRASCPRTSGRCSARARGRSAGSRSPAIRRTSAAPTSAVLELFPEKESLRRWIELAQRADRVPGPAGAHLLARATASAPRRGCAFNELVRNGEVKAPIVIGRDHLDCGSVASPEPRDRGDEGRLRRGRRLAHPQRAGQRGERRVVGVASTTAAAWASATRCTPGR